MKGNINVFIGEDLHIELKKYALDNKITLIDAVKEAIEEKVRK